MKQWDGTDRRKPGSDGERIAIQEALQSIMKEEIDGLRSAVTILTTQITSLASVLSERTSDFGKTDVKLGDRIAKLELAQASLKSFVAGISFAFGSIGAVVGASVDLLVRWHHG